MKADEIKLNSQMITTGDAKAILPVEDGKYKPVKVFGNETIREGFDQICLQQAMNCATAPGVSDVILNPDGHAGYGAPIGSVLASPSHIYPGPVGVDIKCSMSLLQLNIPADAIQEKSIRRALINAICERTPTGAGKSQRSAKKSRRVDAVIGKRVVIEGASPAVCEALGIPSHWASRCEDAFHTGHDETSAALENRLEYLIDSGQFSNFADKVMQLGTYGGGNHFGECEIVEVLDSPRARKIAAVFGLKDGHVAFFSHCGSRGFGYHLAQSQFRNLQKMFNTWRIPYPADSKHLVYAPLGTPEADAYIDDMSMGGNFATVNHMLINALVLEAFQEVLPGTTGELVYFISHNIARREIVDNRKMWVHRKGATRAFPANHFALKDTPFYSTGHPILLPGNPQAGSAVMVGEPGAIESCYSVNHGAGRAMGRKHAIRELDQQAVDASFDEMDILTNCRQYPKDEAPAAYKDFQEVVKSVEQAGLASTVAKLNARFVIKDTN